MPDLEKIRDEALRVSNALQAAVNPTIDAMDENAGVEVNAHLMMGLLVGARFWIGQFRALESKMIAALPECGVDLEDYKRMVERANLVGGITVEMLMQDLG